MDAKSYALGFKVVDNTVTTVAVIVEVVGKVPSGFKFLGCEIGADLQRAASRVTSFCAGATQAIKFRTGKCRVLSHEETKA